MRGDHGSLGIQLAEEIVPRAITIDHIAMQLSFRNDAAPRTVSIWGLQPRRNRRDTGTRHVLTGLHLSYESGLPDLHPNYYYREFVLLGNFTYEITAANPIQSFDLVREGEESDLIMETLLFVFEDNWGSTDYTCIYRVRVHDTFLGEICKIFDAYCQSH